MILKRYLDLVICSLGIVLISPLAIVIALLIKWESSGPIIFKQQRVGLNGKLFYIYKFRSMIDKAISEGLGLQTSSSDYRVTKIGRLLREYHLDEIPQILNVLMGDMSLVGPRPTLPHQLDHYTEEQKQRHGVRPGITGLAQVNGNNELDWDERIALDLWYIRNYSLLLDVKIILKTFAIVLTRKGVYSKNGMVLDKKKYTAE